MSVALGLIDSIIAIQVPAIIGLLFPQHSESAFALMKLVQSLGALFSFFLSPLLPFTANVTLVLVALAVAFACVVYLHYRVADINGGGDQAGAAAATNAAHYAPLRDPAVDGPGAEQ